MCFHANHHGQVICFFEGLEVLERNTPASPGCFLQNFEAFINCFDYPRPRFSGVSVALRVGLPCGLQ